MNKQKLSGLLKEFSELRRILKIRRGALVFLQKGESITVGIMNQEWFNRTLVDEYNADTGIFTTENIYSVRESTNPKEEWDILKIPAQKEQRAVSNILSGLLKKFPIIRKRIIVHGEPIQNLPQFHFRKVVRYIYVQTTYQEETGILNIIPRYNVIVLKNK